LQLLQFATLKTIPLLLLLLLLLLWQSSSPLFALKHVEGLQLAALEAKALQLIVAAAHAHTGSLRQQQQQQQLAYHQQQQHFSSSSTSAGAGTSQQQFDQV
jgi:hypothetical protein